MQKCKLLYRLHYCTFDNGMYTLEKYRGSKTRHTCPECGSRQDFTYYVDGNGNYFASHVGRCNRESSCGYNFTPTMYFNENPAAAERQRNKYKNRDPFDRGDSPQESHENRRTIGDPDYIPFELFKSTLRSYEQNNFTQFLSNLFPGCGDEVQNILKKYFVGTFQDYTCFPYIDRSNRICRGKLIRYNSATGNRLKGYGDTSSLVTKLKIKENFEYSQIFFGEHLLTKKPDSPVAIVEAEKTAIVASMCFSEFVWLSTGSKSWLKVERIKTLGNRKIILYPDADGFDLWETIALDARKQGLNVKTSSLIEKITPNEEKINGDDLADYLIREQKQINKYNTFVDSYNTKLQTVLNTESLLQDFETILAEQKSILIIDGNLSEGEAEKQLNNPENIRQIILSL